MLDLGSRPRETTGSRINAILDAFAYGQTAAYRDVSKGTVVCEAINPANTDTNITADITPWVVRVTPFSCWSKPRQPKEVC